MSDLKKVIDRVKEILKEDQAARNSDTYLYYQVIKGIGESKGVNIEQVSLKDYIPLSKELKFPPFESISRARRKLQSVYAELRGNEFTERKRVEREIEYFKFYS